MRTMLLPTIIGSSASKRRLRCYCGAGESWHATGASPELLRCQFGTSHLVQAPSIRAKPRSARSHSTVPPQWPGPCGAVQDIFLTSSAIIPLTAPAMIPRLAIHCEGAGAAPMRR
jgi:hypothetical protein